MGCQDTVSRTQSRNSKSKTLDSKLTAFRVLANREELRWISANAPETKLRSVRAFGLFVSRCSY